jgi:hypothetical protein
MNRMTRFAVDSAIVLTGVAAVYFGYKYDALLTKTEKEAGRQAIWDACKDNLLKEIDGALALHVSGQEDLDDKARLRAATLRNRVYEAYTAKNEDLRSEVEKQIQQFLKNGK